MDKNPYESPQSDPEIETSAPMAFSELLSRLVLAGIYSSLQMVAWKIFWVQTHSDSSLAFRRLMIPYHFPLACLVGVLITWWTMRAPESKWILAVALLLGVSFVPLALIGMVFFGVR